MSKYIYFILGLILYIISTYDFVYDFDVSSFIWLFLSIYLFIASYQHYKEQKHFSVYYNITDRKGEIIETNIMVIDDYLHNNPIIHIEGFQLISCVEITKNEYSHFILKHKAQSKRIIHL